MKYDTYGIGIFFPLGSLNDPFNKNGTYHLLEHLLFEKTDTQKHKRKLDTQGGIYNGFTSYEIMGFFSQVMKNKKEVANHFILSFLTDLTINEDKLENEKKIVEQELALASRNIFNRNQQFLYNSLGNEGQAILGSKDSLKKITLNDLKNAHTLLKKNYVITDSEGYIQESLNITLQENVVKEVHQQPSKILLLNKEQTTSAIISFAFYLPKKFDFIAEQFMSYFYRKIFLILREKYQLIYKGEKNKILTIESCVYSFSFQIHEKDIKRVIHIFKTNYNETIASSNIYREIKKNSLIEKNRKLLTTDNPIGYVKRVAVKQIIKTKQNDLSIEKLVEKLNLYTPNVVIYSSNNKVLSEGFELYEI